MCIREIVILGIYLWNVAQKNSTFWPPFQTEAKCKTIDMKMSFLSHAIKTPHPHYPDKFVHTETPSLNFQLYAFLESVFEKLRFKKCCPSTLKLLAGVFKFIHTGHARERFRKVTFSKCFSSTLKRKFIHF